MSELRGALQVQNNLAAKFQELATLSQGALVKAAHKIRNDAFDMTPKDTGTLRDSYKITVETDTVIIENTAEYAAAVHENLEANHPIGEAKFLEKAVDANAGYVQGLIKAELEKAL